MIKSFSWRRSSVGNLDSLFTENKSSPPRRSSIGNMDASTLSNVHVAIRIRPPASRLAKDEIQPPCVSTSTHLANVVEFLHLSESAKTFTYDHVFTSNATQEEVYTSSLQPLMTQFLDGFNVTVIAYGQTGSGKTYTMGDQVSVENTPRRERSIFDSVPVKNVSSVERNDLNKCQSSLRSISKHAVSPPPASTYSGAPKDGLLPRFLSDLFLQLNNEPSIRTFNVSFLEIYCDTVRDLLDDRGTKTPLAIRDDEHHVWVENLKQVRVENLAKALELLNKGRSRQVVGANALNDQSSRSHAVYTLEVSRQFQNQIKKSKLTFVDLAGSERLKKSQVEGQRKKESIQINVGLSTLGQVINALADDQRLKRRNSQPKGGVENDHIPYRSSKLTRLLRDALGGNSRTLFIACVSPVESNADDTLSTLQYANRVRNIQNKAEKNVDEQKSPRELVRNSSQLEIIRLEGELTQAQEQVKTLTALLEERDNACTEITQEKSSNLFSRRSSETPRLDKTSIDMTDEVIEEVEMDHQETVQHQLERIQIAWKRTKLELSRVEETLHMTQAELEATRKECIEYQCKVAILEMQVLDMESKHDVMLRQLDQTKHIMDSREEQWCCERRVLQIRYDEIQRDMEASQREADETKNKLCGELRDVREQASLDHKAAVDEIRRVRTALDSFASEKNRVQIELSTIQVGLETSRDEATTDQMQKERDQRCIQQLVDPLRAEICQSIEGSVERGIIQRMNQLKDDLATMHDSLETDLANAYDEVAVSRRQMEDIRAEYVSFHGGSIHEGICDGGNCWCYDDMLQKR